MVAEQEKKAVRGKWLYWTGGVLTGALAIILSEGVMIATTKAFGVAKATLLRVVFTIPASWMVIYLATRARLNVGFSQWLAKREASLSKRARMAVEGGKWFVIGNTALFLGPIITSILMLMIGFKARLVYVYAAVFAVIVAWLWAAFYSGMLWGLAKIFV